MEKEVFKLVYLFRNKLICGYCGKSISAESGTARNMKKFIQNQIKPKMIEIKIKFYV